MDEPQNQEAENPVKNVPLRCPYLGLFSDPQTLIANADPRNYCHYVFPPSSVLISHQETHCLQKNHTRCEVYLQEGMGYFPDILFDNPDGTRKGQKRSRQSKDQGKKAVVAATIATAQTTSPVVSASIAPTPVAAPRGQDKGVLGNEIIGAKHRINGGAQSRTRWQWIGILFILLIFLVISIFGIYTWYGSLQNELQAERAFGQAMATSAYDSTVLAGEVQAQSTRQAATVTALAGAFQSQSTAQAATLIALTQAVTPAPAICQDAQSLIYDIVTGPELIPPAGTTYVNPPPERLRALWKITNNGTCSWQKLLLWSIGDGQIIIPVIQRGKVLLDPLALNQPDGIAPGETIDVMIEFDPAMAVDVDRELVLMINDLSLMEHPRLLLEVKNWILRVTPTVLPTSTSVPVIQPPPQATNPPQPTSPPPRPTDPPYPTRPPAATSIP
jgi:hypothetical protein